MIDETIIRARGRVGSVVNEKWHLDEMLGVGGMACVYSATHRNGRRVAIKFLHPQMCAVPSVVTRFLREGYLANRVGHPGAVAVLDDDRTEDGAVFLVMELLDGHSLERYAKAGRPLLPRGTTLRLMAETLDVLAAAHARGIIHRDIKPANLFLTNEGHVKVLDFGIARLLEASGDGQQLTQSGSSIGTPSFMPPEQARGRWEQVDARTDVWAVGATTYALLRGDRPRNAETTQEELLLAMTQPLQPLASVVPDIAPEIAAVVDRAVAHEREARWADAAAMRQAIAGLLENPVLLDGGMASRPSVNARLDSHGAGGTLVVPDSALTTGRPFASQPVASQRSRARGSQGVLVAIAAIVTLGLLATAGVLTLGRSHRAIHAAAPQASGSTTVTATTSTAATPVGEPVPSSSPGSASASPGSASASPEPSSSVAPPARPSARPSAAPRGPAANPFDQRF